MEYIALHSWNCTYHMGTLSSILDEIEGEGNNVDDYLFYEIGKEVEVTLEKKLTLVVKE